MSTHHNIIRTNDFSVNLNHATKDNFNCGFKT